MVVTFFEPENKYFLGLSIPRFEVTYFGQAFNLWANIFNFLSKTHHIHNTENSYLLLHPDMTLTLSGLALD